MKFRVLLAATSLVTAFGTTTVLAQALPIVGGTTAVRLDSAPVLTGAGVAVAPLGTAMVSPGSTGGFPIAYFPVTGGSINTITFAGQIEHDGSGLSLTRMGNTVELENFLINTVTLKLLGDVSVGTTTLPDVELFNVGLSAITTYPFSLTLTAGAAGALTTFLGLPDLTGALIGNANSIPITAAIPEPSTYLMMLAGLGLVGFLARRRVAFVRGPLAA